MHNLEQFFGIVATRNPGQFHFRVVDNGTAIEWERGLSATHHATGTFPLIDGETYEAMHARFWDAVFATPWRVA